MFLRKTCKINVKSRTLTPLILVRIQVPQPIEIVRLSAESSWNRIGQLGAQLGVLFSIRASALHFQPVPDRDSDSVHLGSRERLSGYVQ
jgi:hypothetical protein